MPSRRSHQKSHHGCNRCRTLRVKCDEVRPTCSKCAKRKTDCIYRDLATQFNPFTTSITENPSGYRALRQTSCIASPSIGLSIDPDHRLFEYYINSVSGTVPMLKQSENLERWDRAVRRYAISQDYLLSSILAISSLHRAIHDPNDKTGNIARACRYQDLAIKAFKPALNHVTAYNCEPALVCAAMLYVFTFAIPVATETVPNQSYDVISNTLQLVSLFRGVQLLFRLGYQQQLDKNISPKIRQTILAGLVDGKSVPDLESSLDLLSPIMQTNMSDEKALFYAKCLQNLKAMYRRLAVRPQDVNILAGFMVNMDKRFLDDMRSSEPITLIMLAHWAAGLHGFRGVWWSLKWAHSAVRSIAGLLDEVWLPHLQWPLEKTATE